jgi:F0F1-type ATP synthase delta subunit
MEHKAAEPAMVLPIAVVGRVDIGRLQRETEALLNFIQQSAIRQPGTQPKLPKTSRLLDEVIQNNKINILEENDCKQLLKFLQHVYRHAPVIHISFGADPSAMFTQKIVTWLRVEVNPLVLLQIGLQPNIGAGCIVRTTNKYFDFSLRHRFEEKKSVLSAALKGAKA